MSSFFLWLFPTVLVLFNLQPTFMKPIHKALGYVLCLNTQVSYAAFIISDCNQAQKAFELNANVHKLTIVQ